MDGLHIYILLKQILDSTIIIIIGHIDQTQILHKLSPFWCHTDRKTKFHLHIENSPL